jgi:hypothetical protein
MRVRRAEMDESGARNGGLLPAPVNPHNKGKKRKYASTSAISPLLGLEFHRFPEYKNPRFSPTTPGQLTLHLFLPSNPLATFDPF